MNSIYSSNDRIYNNLKAKATQILQRDYFKNIVIPHLLSPFLPLDIDMQALKIIWDNPATDNNDEKTQKTMNYLTNETDGMLQDTRVNYPEKLKMAKEEVSNYQEWKDNKFLNNLLGEKISGFLDLLEKKKKAVISGGRSLRQDEIEEIIQYFSKDRGWTVEVEGAEPKVITSFHDWYCALDRYLRGKTGE